MIAVFFTIAIAIVVTVSVISQRRLKKRIWSIEYDKKFAEKELRDLKCRLAERTRVACDLRITPYDLAHAPDDFLDWQAENACHELTLAMAKTFEYTVKERVKEILTKIKVESMFTPPFGEVINVSVPIFKIDTVDVKVIHRDLKNRG